MDAGDAGILDHTMGGSIAPLAINENDSLSALRLI
jgi:hypothetical protein